MFFYFVHLIFILFCSRSFGVVDYVGPTVSQVEHCSTYEEAITAVGKYESVVYNTIMKLIFLTPIFHNN